MLDQRNNNILQSKSLLGPSHNYIKQRTLKHCEYQEAFDIICYL